MLGVGLEKGNQDVIELLAGFAGFGFGAGHQSFRQATQHIRRHLGTLQSLQPTINVYLSDAFGLHLGDDRGDRLPALLGEDAAGENGGHLAAPVLRHNEQAIVNCGLLDFAVDHRLSPFGSVMGGFIAADKSDYTCLLAGSQARSEAA